jgi:hypothetical protein
VAVDVIPDELSTREVIRDPYPAYRRLRERSPAMRASAHITISIMGTTSSAAPSSLQLCPVFPRQRFGGQLCEPASRITQTFAEDRSFAAGAGEEVRTHRATTTWLAKSGWNAGQTVAAGRLVAILLTVPDVAYHRVGPPETVNCTCTGTTSSCSTTT